MSRKVQLKPLKHQEREENGEVEVTEALLIMKWGGVLTHAGKEQAEKLGRQFRNKMYSARDVDTDELLLLHATFRHNLKIYSSDEGRVQMSAAAFAKGLLDLDTQPGQLAPILVALVTMDTQKLDMVRFCQTQHELHTNFGLVLYSLAISFL